MDAWTDALIWERNLKPVITPHGDAWLQQNDVEWNGAYTRAVIEAWEDSMGNQDDALAFLMGAGVPTANFLEVGTKHEGRITNFEKRQQRDMDTGKPKFWDDGEPVWQLIFTIDTGVIDPEIEADDGVRKIYAKGQMIAAIREAVKKSGHRGDLVGGFLGVKYVRNGQATRRGFNPPKEYAAKFEPAPQTDALEDEYSEAPFIQEPQGDEPF